MFDGDDDNDVDVAVLDDDDNDVDGGDATPSLYLGPRRALLPSPSSRRRPFRPRRSGDSLPDKAPRILARLPDGQGSGPD